MFTCLYTKKIARVLETQRYSDTKSTSGCVTARKHLSDRGAIGRCSTDILERAMEAELRIQCVDDFERMRCHSNKNVEKCVTCLMRNIKDASVYAMLHYLQRHSLI